VGAQKSQRRRRTKKKAETDPPTANREAKNQNQSLPLTKTKKTLGKKGRGGNYVNDHSEKGEQRNN